MTSVQDVIKKCSPWMRLSICINIHVKKALINVLHNHINDPKVQPLPSNSVDLYAFLQTKKKKIQKSTNIKEHQKSLLLPANTQHVDSSSFDITLIRFLIQKFCGIQNAKRNWKEPDSNDQTICAYVYRAAALRNAIFHDDNIEEMTVTEFENKWKQLEEILQGLMYVEDIEPFKKETLDFKKCEHAILEEFVDHLRSYKEECLKEPSQDDYILRRFYVDGNKDDIVTEKDFEILMKDNDCVIIYGEAGIGKSSTAKKIKSKWCNERVFHDHNIIYYDSKRMNKQLTVQTNAAPLVFSELGDHLKKKKRTEYDLSIYKCVKTSIDNLIILIDGIDEFPVRELVDENYVDELEKKVMNNERITGTETISAIYYGFLFPYSKVILLGRISEFESLKKVKVKGNAVIFNRKTVNLELLQFDDANIKELSCLKICKQPSRQTNCTIGACYEIHEKIKNIELCKNPTDLNSLIELLDKHPNKDIGKITRTKLIIATLFNRLTNHIKLKNNCSYKTFREISQQKDSSKYLECILTLGEISFKTLLEDNIAVQVKEEQDTNAIVYFKYENQINIERKILEKLDLFYVRDFGYYFILEPHHTLNIEFLSACYLFSHPDKWNSILELINDRQLETIKFVAGLYADDYFTEDFIVSVLKISSNYSIEQFFSWLYGVRESLPNGGAGDDCWYGLMENQKLSPPYCLLDSISHEVEIPHPFIPKTVVCYCDYRSSFEWYNRAYCKQILTKFSDKINIESFLKKSSNLRFIIKGSIRIYDKDEFNQLDRYGTNSLITFKINELHILTSLDTCFTFSLNLNSLYLMRSCCPRTIDLILDTLLPSSTNTSSNIQPIQCKRLGIQNITQLNDLQTEKLITIGLSGFVDFIALGEAFFRDEQIEILKDVECKNTNKRINIEVWNTELRFLFDLPNLGNRHISLYDVFNVTDNDLIEFKEHMVIYSTEYSNNFSNYKIIYNNSYPVPFVRHENCLQDLKQSMYLDLYEVDFRQVSSEVFSNTFALVPSLACQGNDYYIPSSHWMSLSQTEHSQINELRIWDPEPKNFEHFLNIKTNTMQLICRRKEDLKRLLNHIVDNPNVQSDKEMKVFIVKYDENDWDYYDEITLLHKRKIEEYKINYSLDDLLLNNIRAPFHEGEQHIKLWCCEISSPTNKMNMSWLLLGSGLVLGLGFLLKHRFIR